MRLIHRLGALLAIGWLVLLVQPAVAQEWRETRSAEGRFKVLMPGDAKASRSNQIYQFLAEAPGSAYIVLYTDIDEAKARRAGAKAILAGAQAGGIRQVQNPSLQREMDISLAGHPGREFHFIGTFEGERHHHYWRAYLVRNRLYSLGAVGEKPIDDQMRNRFFGSFELLSPGGGGR